MQPSHFVVTATASEINCRVFSSSFPVLEFAALSVWYPRTVSGLSFINSPNRAPISLWYSFQSIIIEFSPSSIGDIPASIPLPRSGAAWDYWLWYLLWFAFDFRRLFEHSLQLSDSVARGTYYEKQLQ